MEAVRQVETLDSQIETLARELAKRDGRGGGRATAIIGAGFSRNADPQSDNRRRFPLWRDIVRPLIDELVPPCARCPNGGHCPNEPPPGCKLAARRRALFEDAAGASGMMTLGDKFEAQRGKARLHAALKTAVPDQDYAPGKAHQLLVRLPWADIFTTNWDTLLERAVDAYDRSYDTVVTVEQIASTSSPRIVKLHGCVRSGAPLIFTEEDFRTYPTTYAPFVSLVQQSLMENVVVLFGFSGADPNFRAWHGWVRDHLGRHTQPIYMVTLQPADAVDVHLMSRRLISPIDLSSKWKDADPSVMIERFLHEINRRLRSLRDNLDWPSSRILPGDGHSDGPAQDLKDWRRRLDIYPRWLVAPAQNRANLLASLDEAVSFGLETPAPELPAKHGALAALATNPPPRRNGASLSIDTDSVQAAVVVAESLRIAFARPGDLLFERLWRILGQVLVDALAPSPAEEAAPAAEPSLLERLTALIGDIAEAAPRESGDDEAARVDKLRFGAEEVLGASGYVAARRAIKGLTPLIEVVEREARFRGWTDLSRALRETLWLAGGDDEVRELAVRSTLACAQAELDLVGVEAMLALWPDRPHDAASHLRHAATRREIGRFAEAEREIEGIVNRLRSLGSARRRDIAEASREAWAFYLYADLLETNKQVLKPIIERRHRNIPLEEVVTELYERLDELEARGRDPRREIDRVARDLEAAMIQARMTRQPAAPQYRYVVCDPATTFAVFSETVGVAVDLVYKSNRLALSAARLLAPAHRRLAIGLLLRAGTPEDLPFPSQRETFSGGLTGDSLVTDAVFDGAQAAQDLEYLGRTLERLVIPPATMARAEFNPTYLDRKIGLLQHLIAGLIARSPDARAAERGFELACAVADSPVVSATRAGWSNLPLLFQRSLEQFVSREFDAFRILMKLLDLPIPGEADEGRARGWPDPFRLLVRVLSASSASPPRSSSAPSTLRPIGEKLVERARKALEADPTRIPLLEERRKTLGAIAANSGLERRTLLSRRLEILDRVLAEAARVASPPKRRR
jgi:hypothetical protein